MPKMSPPDIHLSLCLKEFSQQKGRGFLSCRTRGSLHPEANTIESAPNGRVFLISLASLSVVISGAAINAKNAKF